MPAAAKPQPKPTPPPPPPPEAKPVETLPVPVMETGLVASISRAELSQMMEAARERPRSLKQFKDDAISIATLDEETAKECIYAIPRKERGVTKMIRGPSVRFAEILVPAYKHCRVYGRIVDVGKDYVTAQGIFHDLQNDVQYSFEEPRRIVNSYGQRYTLDMIITTGKAAQAIAQRNAVLKGIPKALWNAALKAAMQIIAGTAETLIERRAKLIAELNKQGATNEQIFGTLGVRGLEDIGLDELTTLQGLSNAVREENYTIEEIFAQKPQAPVGVAGAKEVLGSTG